MYPYGKGLASLLSVTVCILSTHVCAFIDAALHKLLQRLYKLCDLYAYTTTQECWLYLQTAFLMMMESTCTSQRAMKENKHKVSMLEQTC